MNKIYLIIPLVLTLAFSGFYLTHRKEAAVKAQQVQADAAKVAAEAQAKKVAAEKQARDDADRRTAERVAEEKKKEDEKRAKWEAIGKTIADDTTTYVTQAEKNAAELKALQAKLTAVREEKDRATQANLDFDLEVEKARVAKRSSELEIQRLVEMVARNRGTTLGAVTATP